MMSVENLNVKTSQPNVQEKCCRGDQLCISQHTSYTTLYVHCSDGQSPYPLSTRSLLSCLMQTSLIQAGTVRLTGFMPRNHCPLYRLSCICCATDKIEFIPCLHRSQNWSRTVHVRSIPPYDKLLRCIVMFQLSMSAEDFFQNAPHRFHYALCWRYEPQSDH